MARHQRPSVSEPIALSDHLGELKNRFFIVVLVLLLSSSFVYVFRASIIPIILEPYKASFDSQQLMYLSPAGGFSFIFFVSIYLGLAVTLPVLIHQLYGFIRPALPKQKRSISGRLLISSALLLVAGILFGYYIAVPGALSFLSEFASDYVSASLTADSYLHFLVAYTIGLGILFQIPLILILIHFITPLTPSGLLKSQRWVIVLVLIAAALITPTPDPVNMMVVAVPILVIYQLGVAVVLVSIYKNRRKNKASQPKLEQIKLVNKNQVIETQPAQQAASPKPLPSTKPSNQPLAEPAASLKTNPITVHARSLDGFSVSNRQPRNLNLPARSVQPLRRSVPRSVSRSVPSGRYIDGISPVFKSS